MHFFVTTEFINKDWNGRNVVCQKWLENPIFLYAFSFYRVNHKYDVAMLVNSSSNCYLLPHETFHSYMLLTPSHSFVYNMDFIVCLKCWVKFGKHRNKNPKSNQMKHNIYDNAKQPAIQLFDSKQNPFAAK